MKIFPILTAGSATRIAVLTSITADFLKISNELILSRNALIIFICHASLHTANVSPTTHRPAHWPSYCTVYKTYAVSQRSSYDTQVAYFCCGKSLNSKENFLMSPFQEWHIIFKQAHVRLFKRSFPVCVCVCGGEIEREGESERQRERENTQKARGNSIHLRRFESL